MTIFKVGGSSVTPERENWCLNPTVVTANDNLSPAGWLIHGFGAKTLGDNITVLHGDDGAYVTAHGTHQQLPVNTPFLGNFTMIRGTVTDPLTQEVTPAAQPYLPVTAGEVWSFAISGRVLSWPFQTSELTANLALQVRWLKADGSVVRTDTGPKRLFAHFRDNDPSNWGISPENLGEQRLKVENLQAPILAVYVSVTPIILDSQIAPATDGAKVWFGKAQIENRPVLRDWFDGDHPAQAPTIPVPACPSLLPWRPSFSDAIAATTNPGWLWNFRRIRWSDDTYTHTPPMLIGVGRKPTQVVKYYQTTSTSTIPSVPPLELENFTPWTTSIPATTTQKPYLWGFSRVAYNDGALPRLEHTPAILLASSQGSKHATSLVEYYQVSHRDPELTTKWAGIPYQSTSVLIRTLLVVSDVAKVTNTSLRRPRPAGYPEHMFDVGTERAYLRLPEVYRDADIAQDYQLKKYLSGILDVYSEVGAIAERLSYVPKNMRINPVTPQLEYVWDEEREEWLTGHSVLEIDPINLDAVKGYSTVYGGGGDELSPYCELADPMLAEDSWVLWLGRIHGLSGTPDELRMMLQTPSMGLADLVNCLTLLGFNDVLIMPHTRTSRYPGAGTMWDLLIVTSDPDDDVDFEDLLHRAGFDIAGVHIRWEMWQQTWWGLHTYIPDWLDWETGDSWIKDEPGTWNDWRTAGWDAQRQLIADEQNTMLSTLTYQTRTAFPPVGVATIFYVAADTGYRYRWSNGHYIQQ